MDTLEQGLLDQAEVGVFVLDAATLKAQWANAAYLRFLEHPFRERGIVGLHLQEFIPDALDSGLVEIFHDVAGRGVSYLSDQYEFDGFERGTTYWRWSLHRVDGLAPEDAPRLLGMAIDITDDVCVRRERDERFDEMACREEFIGRVLDKVDNPISYVDSDLVYRQCNTAAAEAMGRPASRIIGSPLADVVGTNSHVYEGVKRVIETGVPIHDKVEYTVDDHAHYYSVAWVPDVVDGQVVGAVTTAFDITIQERSAQFRAALASIMTTIVGTLDADRMLAGVAREVVSASGADFALLLDRESPGWRLRLAEGAIDPGVLHHHYSDSELPLSTLAYREERVQVSSEVGGHAGSDDMLAGYHAVIAVPLRRQGCQDSVLSLVYANPTRIDEPLVEFIENMGRAVTLALQAASVYEHQRHVAETLQESLLTIPGHLKGVRTAHLYESAVEDERIGGDFYDAFTMGNKVFFAVGDVSGKGLDAATLTALTKNALRAHILDTGSPAQALTKVNEVVVAFTELEEFVTVFAGLLDIRTGQLTYVSAGHPPPLIVDGRKVRRVPGTQPLLGAFPGMSYRDRTHTLRLGDTLLLYTDGIIEARNAEDGLFGEYRLAELLRDLDESDMDGMVYEIFDAVRKYSHESLRDDIALMALRPTAISARAVEQPRLVFEEDEVFDLT